jgi:putative membrane protein
MRMHGLRQMRAGALVLGTAAALAACGTGDNAANDSATAAATMAGDSASMAAGATTGMTGDSAGMAGAGGAMGDPAIAGTINTSNAAEIGTSELARDRATNAEVKRFANDMITEHRRMQAEADQIAQRNNLTPQPAGQADQMQQMVTATLDSLRGLRGAEFDQRYMAFQVQSHQMTLDNLQRFEGQAQNADLKAMITKAIPAVRGHLERAQRIQTSLGGAAAGATRS